MSKNKRSHVIVAITIIIALTITLPITVFGTETIVTVGLGGEPSSLFPLASDQAAADRVSSICEPLVNIDQDAKPLPVLATRWEVIDGKKWRFYLRKGVTFHNGEEFTAEDVAYTVEYCTDPNNKCARRGLVKDYSVEIVDKYTIDIVNKDELADPILPEAWYAIRILPKDTLKEIGHDKFSRAPIGTGPFKFQQWLEGEQVVLVANEKYWGGRPIIDKIIIKTIPEAGTRLIGLKTGQLDIIENIPPTEIASLEKDNKIEIRKKPSLWVMHLQLRCDIPPFKDNIDLRKAVVHAIDIEAISKEIMGGFAQPVGGITPPLAFGYNDELKPHKYDPKLAKEYLKKSGYKGEQIDIVSSNGRYFMDIDINTAVVGYLKAIGINTNLILNDWPTWINKWSNKKIEPIHLIGWADNSGDGVENLYDVCHTNSNYNWLPVGGIPEVNNLIRTAQTNLNRDVRLNAIKKADKIMHDYYYWGFCYAPIQVYGVNKNLKWSPRADQTLSFTVDDNKTK